MCESLKVCLTSFVPDTFTVELVRVKKKKRKKKFRVPVAETPIMHIVSGFHKLGFSLKKKTLYAAETCPNLSYSCVLPRRWVVLKFDCLQLLL